MKRFVNLANGVALAGCCFCFQNEAKNLNDIYDILKSCEK